MKNINSYFRVLYNGMGVYEALKQEILSNNKFSKEDWKNFINSDKVNWLNKPNANIYSDKVFSYFTRLGFELFMEKTYPLIIKYLDKKRIKVENIYFDFNNIELLYEDKYQIVVKGLI